MKNAKLTQWILCALGLWLLSQQCGQCFYDPNFQRWINRDPIMERGGCNLYTISRNDVINRFDPRGLQDSMESYLLGQPVDPLALLHGLSQFLQALTPLGGKCKNTSSSPEWALVAGPVSDDHWKKLNPGESTGPFEDCDVMTCGGGFYKVSGMHTGNCAHPGSDCPYYKKRRWTPSNNDPNIISPSQIEPGINPMPPGYQYNP
jgi:hypothetical protein